jgi:protein-S-isoprenylcysteine O-methyltransferase Ste14
VRPLGDVIRHFIEFLLHLAKKEGEFMNSNLQSRFLSILMIPWVDKVIAIVAVLPFAREIYQILMSGQMNIPRANLVIQFLVVIGTMVLRHPPVRITPNPFYWLLAFVASYWGLFVGAFVQPGPALAPALVTNSLVILSLLIAAYARLSLGRNIGLVPSQRTIVTGGAYRYVRHPIYTGLLMAYITLVLRMYTPRNLVMALCGICVFVVKSFIEEGFLREDPEYADYLRRVKSRWFPGIA